MNPTKDEFVFAQSGVHELPDVTPGDTSEKLGNEWDQRGMVRLGKKQELRREFHFVSITGYAMILGCSWEFALINVVLTLSNGGKAGTIYMLLVAICGLFFVCLSMAEMASIAPTAGGQYHWTSEFAPRKYQKILSFSVGVFCVLGWQTSLAATCFASAQQITALISLSNQSYEPSQWQTALLSWAILLLAIFANTVLFRKLPLIQGIVTSIHILGFFAFVIVLWTMAPQGTASSVFTEFESNGWPATALACLVGLNGPIPYLSGADSSVHLAEELKNSAWRLPRSMLVTAITNYITSFIIVVTLMFCLGDIESVVESPTGQPYIAVVLNATHSVPAAKVLVVVVLILVVSCSVNGVTTTSRQLWSFARDGGLPFSSWLSQVRPGLDVPVNAMAVSMGFTICLTSIAIGSEVAYGIFVSLNASGLLTSYIVCIACVLQKRLRGDRLPISRFSLGKAGNAINIIALCFLIVFWIFQFFPAAPSPAPSEMNWSCVIWTSVLVFFMTYYAFWGRHNYVGPIAYVKSEV
ncbi:amino acid/polyamine transporter I [Usnea florida]